jgi:hypothetical protein
MKKTILYILIALLTICCVSCSKYDQKVSVSEIKKPQIITLHKKGNQHSIHAMRVHGSGSLAGNAELILMLNNQPYKTEHLNGKIEFTWGGDWYSDSMEIHYQPGKVESGNLNLEYVFYDLK